jgi:hypothetical protein
MEYWVVIGDGEHDCDIRFHSRPEPAKAVKFAAH